MTVDVFGTRANVETRGSGIPVIMIHGWGCDGRMMEGAMEGSFAGRDGAFERIYPDLPGMGRTPAIGEAGSADGMRDFVLALADRLVPGERFAVAGKSYGGYIARGVAKAAPDRVLGMLLLCPVVDPATQKAHSPPRGIVTEREEGIEGIVPADDLAEFCLFHTRQTQVVWERAREFVLPGMKLADRHFLETELGKRVSFRESVDEGSGPYPFPTLMIAGREDWCVGYSDLFGLVERYPRATYLALDGAAHNLEFERPELFRAHATEWLDGVARYERATRVRSGAVTSR